MTLKRFDFVASLAELFPQAKTPPARQTIEKSERGVRESVGAGTSVLRGILRLALDSSPGATLKGDAIAMSCETEG